MTETKRFKPAAYAASELDLLHDMVGEIHVCELPVDVAALQWDGVCLHVFDAENADEVANGLCDHANYLDQESTEDARIKSAICRGLWNIAGKIREHYAFAV